VKLAVLISGSLRTFSSAWPHNERILSSLDIDYDIYLHTWTEIFGTHRNVAKAKAPRRLFWRWLPTKFESAQSYYPQEFISPNLKTQILVEDFPDLAKNILHYSDVSSSKNALRFKNSCAMYLGMEKVARMALDSQNDYSHFLRLRTDFLLSPKFSIDLTQEIVMCGDGVNLAGHHISDQCFYAPWGLINPIMFNFQNLRESVADKGWFNQDYGYFRKAEFVLFENLISNNLIDCTHAVPRRKFGKILRDVETRDFDASLSSHYKGLIAHNRLVILKLSKLAFADLRRRIGKVRKFVIKIW
jgi:hypothetical protein